MSSEPHEEYVDGWYVSDEDVPVPDWHLAIIKERMERYRREGTTWTPLEEFEKEVEELMSSLKE